MANKQGSYIGEENKNRAGKLLFLLKNIYPWSSGNTRVVRRLCFTILSYIYSFYADFLLIKSRNKWLFTLQEHPIWAVMILLHWFPWFSNSYIFLFRYNLKTSYIGLTFTEALGWWNVLVLLILKACLNLRLISGR